MHRTTANEETVRVIRPSAARRAGALLGLLMVAALAAPAPTGAASFVPFTLPLKIPPVLTGANVTLTAAQTPVQIMPGAKTMMWTYNGMFPGPTIRQTTGHPTRVTLVNNLPASAGEITLHNHGNHSTTENDGQPDDFLIPTGGSYTYTYTGTENGGNQRAALQWYHDHRMDVTGRNVWMGLAGMYLVDDPSEPQTLPKGVFDVPLMIVDRTFDSKNQISYTFNKAGDLGTQILVNGVPQPYFTVGDRSYRLRILNASNFRAYDLALSDGQTFTQIGTESGLLPKPVKRTHMVIGPAERVDVVVSFAGHLGQKIVLKNLGVSGSLGQVMQFRVTRNLTETSSVPAAFRPLPKLDPISAVTREFDFGQSRVTGQWTINGQVMDMARIDAMPRLGTTETWILKNTGKANHYVHIHEEDQQLVSRNGAAPPPWEAIKETWNISGGQTVVIRLKFTDNLGVFVFHCHVLEHEDAGMMAQYEVVQ